MQAEPVPLAQLTFDPRNPRLPPAPPGGALSDAEVVRYLMADADLTELLESIAANGYIDLEPLLVTSEAAPAGGFIVLEGNRRLAALKLLTDPALKTSAGVAVPELAPQAQIPNEVLAFKLPSRRAAREFIGFKHINGPHRWDSLAKARFASEWYQSAKMDGGTLRQIARKLGDKHDTVLRMVQGYLALEQAKDDGTYDPQDRTNVEAGLPFSHLYTALTRPSIRKFVGMDPQVRTVDPEERPFKDSAKARQLMEWLFGSREKGVAPVVVKQNPDLNHLADVLESDKATAVLLETRDLTQARAALRSDIKQLEESIIGAKKQLQRAKALVATAYDGSASLLANARAAKEDAEHIHDTMTKIWVAAQEAESGSVP